MSRIMEIKVATDIAAGTVASAASLTILMEATMSTMAAITTIGGCVLVCLRIGLALREWRRKE
jgi:uncharacterized membrane protein YgdD (TMEM256/DUF423 family)